MTVAAQTPISSYTGNGVTTAFSFGYYVAASGDLVVMVDGVVKALTTDYTLTGIGSGSGGTCTFLTAPASGADVVLYRDTDLSRDTDYQDNGDLLAAILNGDFDRIWLALQETITGAKLSPRAVRAPVGETLNELPEATTRAGKILSFNASTGQPEAVAPTSGTATDLAIQLASTATGNGAALVAFNGSLNYAAGTIGARVGQVVDVTAFPWLADASGVASSTLAIEAAAATLQDGDELWFPPGGTFLIDYPWTAFSDSDSVNLSGRGKAVIYIADRKRITINGNGCRIVTTNHPIDTKGGLIFALFQRSPDCRITGFDFDMSFTGWNTLSTRYPMCGGVWANDKFGGTGVQAAMCCGFEADHLKFKLYHPQGTFAITSAPYGSDNNNGFKVISVFASGDSGATAYANQARSLKIHDIRFVEGNNGYGVWGVAYNDAKFWNIHDEAASRYSYTIAGGTYAGTNFNGPVRFYQYYCDGFSADGIFCRSIPQASRTNNGLCGAVNVHSGLADRTTGSVSIRDVTVILDSASTTLGSTFDVGVYCTASGAVTISDVKIDCHTQSAAIGILLGGNDGTGSADYLIDGVRQSVRVNGPMVEVTNAAASDAARTIKSVEVRDSIARGFGSQGAVYSLVAGSFYGLEHMSVSGCLFSGTGAVGAGFAVDVRGRTSADILVVTDNIFRDASAPFTAGSSTVLARDSYSTGSSANGGVGYLTNNLQQTSTFTAGQAVAISGINTGELYEYRVIEITGAGAVVADSAGLANSGTGTIRTVGAGNTARIVYKRVTSQR